MKKRILLILLTLIILVIVIAIYILNFKTIKTNKYITFTSNKDIEVYANIHIRDLIKEIDGYTTNNNKIDTTKIGTQTINIPYIHNNRKHLATIKINIVDTTEPTILSSSTITVEQGKLTSLINKFISFDNYDDNPKRQIIGDYDLNKIGTYNLTYKITDSSNNETKEDFTLNVVEESQTSNIEINDTQTNFKDVLNNYKTDKNKIGIDISKWQGEIDFDSLKDAGVEFAIVRVGYQTDEGIEEDEYFKKNIEELTKRDIKVGVYFYSKATSINDAKKEAKWVYKKIKDYNIMLVAFDWEEWSNFNNLSLSKHKINEIAKTFMDIMVEYRYTPYIYGSKYYLENIWELNDYSTWLAQYTETPTYENDYRIWQMCSDGVIPGINGYVDIDITNE